MDEEYRYWIQTGTAASVVTGAFLVVEHILTWGGTDPSFGHEWIGLLLVFCGTIGALLSRKKD